MKDGKNQAMGRDRIRKIAFSAAVCAVAWPTGSASALTVHEWGTFTTLSSSAGNGLSGLYVDASRLPGFVHGLPYFNYDPATGWSPLDKLRNVTVKMETPVLYFYADKETPVDVKVDFRGGTISQWYPQCYVCETNPASPYVDFAPVPYPGHIEWKATILAPGTTLPYTTDSARETAEWTAPRATDANPLRGQNGEIEKFLFYRGLGDFPSNVDIRFLPDGRLRVKNVGAEDIPFLMVYERAYGPIYGNDIATVWHNAPLAAGAEITLARDKPFTDYFQGMGPMDVFRAQLQKAGLTDRESQALLNTWYNGYFIEGGLKAFWILPRAKVDAILPLQISPRPDSLVRVIVGRSEILTPEFERNLYHARAVDSLEAIYGQDKYYMAYRDFLSRGGDWHIETATAARVPGMGKPAGDRHLGGTIRPEGMGRPEGSRQGAWSAPLPGAEDAPEAADLLGRSFRLRFSP